MRKIMGFMVGVLLVGGGVSAYAGLNKGANAPAFSLEQVTDEKELSLDTLLKHHKVVFVNIFNTWCGPCKSETPGLVEVYGEYKKKGVEFVSICTPWKGDSAAKAEKFAKQYDMTWPMLYDADGSVTKKYQVSGVPTNVVVTAGNRIEFYRAGGISEDQLRKILDEALNAEPGKAPAVADEADVDDAAPIAPPAKGGPYIGVQLAAIPTDEEEDAPAGVLVQGVQPSSPAETGGLEEGDVISAANGKNVTSVEQLVMMVRKQKVGDMLALSIERNGKKKELKITIGAFTPPGRPQQQEED